MKGRFQIREFLFQKKRQEKLFFVVGPDGAEVWEGAYYKKAFKAGGFFGFCDWKSKPRLKKALARPLPARLY